MHETQSDRWLWQTLAGLTAPRVPESFAEREFDDLLTRAVDEGVGSLLHRALHRSDTWLDLPERFRDALTDHARAAAGRELAAFSELNLVLRDLDGAGLRFIVIKGTALAYSLYPEPYLRERCDTDIVFLDKSEAGKAFALLALRGYERNDALEADTISSQFSCHRRTSGEARLTIDVHWRLNNMLPIAQAFGIEELLERSVHVPRLCNAARAPSALDALLLACLHRAAHRTEGTHNRGIWLYDIHLIAASLDEREWELIISRCRERGISHVVADGIAEARERFATSLPDDVLPSLRNDPGTQSVRIEDYASRLGREYQQLKALPGWSARAGHIASHLFPDSAYLMRKYHAGNRAALPWLYVRRICEGFVKRARGTG